MIKLHSPENEIELALLRSLLEGAEIPYFVHNDHFGTMRIGPRIELFNKKTIMVPAIFEINAKEILADYFKKNEPHDESPKQTYSFADKLRMVFETLYFGWFVPGNRWTEKRKFKKKHSN